MGRGLDGYLISVHWRCVVLRVRGDRSHRFPVAMARGKHLFPFRTEKLSPSAPMVLGPQGPGRVGRRRFSYRSGCPVRPERSAVRVSAVSPRTDDATARLSCRIEGIGGPLVDQAAHGRKGQMGFLHRHDKAGGTRYQMREKVFAIGDDFWIETDGGQRAYKINGKALRIRETFILESPSGEELLKIQEKKLRIRDTMNIERDGETVATVKKALITPLRDRFAIELSDGGELTAKGNIVDHEYKIERDGETVAEVSKRWFRVRETYGIEVAPGENDALLLAATVCIDEMSSRG